MGSRDAEKLLGARLGNTGLDPQRTMAFRGRFDRLRKLGCPTDVNTGKGRAATYGWPQLLQLAVALDLINLGMTPELASSVVTLHQREINLACIRLAQLIDRPEHFENVVRVEKWPLEKTIFLSVDARALAIFKQGDTTACPSVGLIEGIGISDWLSSSTPYDAANVLIDFGTKLAQLIHLVAIWSEADVAEVVKDFSEWAEDVHP